MVFPVSSQILDSTVFTLFRHNNISTAKNYISRPVKLTVLRHIKISSRLHKGDDVRNEWAHFNFKEWDAVKFQSSFKEMQQLFQFLGPPPAGETKILSELNDWENKGSLILSLNQFLKVTTLLNIKPPFSVAFFKGRKLLIAICNLFTHGALRSVLCAFQIELEFGIVGFLWGKLEYPERNLSKQELTVECCG